MAFNFFTPQHSIFGEDAFLDLAKTLKKANYQKALIITDQFLAEKSGYVTELIEILKNEGLKTTIFSDIHPNPTTKNVADGLVALNESQADLIIGFGGGSPCDTAKLVALLKTNGGQVDDYCGIDLAKKPAFPLVIINTTAGTATEVTKNAVITNVQTKTKMVIIDVKITPMIAVNNPKLTLKMPKELTAYTGMDALTHAIESFLNHNNIVLTEELAVWAIKLIKENLIVAYHHPENYEAREKMIYAEYMAGMAFNSAGLGIVHAMSHALGAVYDYPHGYCNAILLPHLIKMNLEFDSQKAQKLASALGAANLKNDAEAIKYVFETLLAFNQELNIPCSLVGLVQDQDLDHLAEHAQADVCTPVNPKPMSFAEIKAMYRQILVFNQQVKSN